MQLSLRVFGDSYYWHKLYPRSLRTMYSIVSLRAVYNISGRVTLWVLGCAEESAKVCLRIKNSAWSTFNTCVFKKTAFLWHANKKTSFLNTVLSDYFTSTLEGEGARWSSSPINRTSLVGVLAAFSFFSKSENREEGEKEEGSEQEDKIIFLLKKAKLSIMKGELEDAERLLHQAVRLAHESNNLKAIIYTYDLMANLAFVRGQYDSAEKLFKAVMSFLLAADKKQDDNAFIEISIKLASIYAAQNRHELAFAGYEFCILTLEEKTEKEKDLPEEVLTAEEKANTRLLFGLCMDSYSRYLLSNKQLPLARTMCERALKISTDVQGEAHPQTVILMNDMAAVLDSQGQYDKAYTYVKRASELAKQHEHPDEHVILSNLAGILMHQGPENFEQAKEVYRDAMKKAEQKRDTAVIQQIEEGLAELSRRNGGSCTRTPLSSSSQN